MIRTFRHRGLKRFHERGDPSRLPTDQISRIEAMLDDLDAATQPRDLELPGNRLHQLKGKRRGQWSVTISGNWRIVFRFEAGEPWDVDLVDYH